MVHPDLVGIYLFCLLFRGVATVFRLLHVAQAVDFIERYDNGPDTPWFYPNKFTKGVAPVMASGYEKPLLSHSKSRHASIRNPGDPFVFLSQSSGALPSPVEPSGVPGEGEASSKPSYLAELRCVFEKTLDGQRRKFPDSDTPIADTPHQAQVRKIFQRLIDEVDTPPDPLPTPEVCNTARCPTTNGVDKPFALAPKARVSNLFQRPIDESRDPGPKPSVPDKRKGTVLERAKARVEQIRTSVGLPVPSKGSDDKKPFSARGGLNAAVPQTDANNPADIGNVAGEPVRSDPVPRTASSGSQCQSKYQRTEPRGSLPGSSAHERYARAIAVANRLSILSELNTAPATTCPLTASEEGQRAVRLSRLYDTLEIPITKPPPCVPSHQDAIAAKRNNLVDEVERMIMLARTNSKPARSQQDSVGCPPISVRLLDANSKKVAL